MLDRQRLPILVLLLATLLLQACSTVRLGYNQLPRLIYWRLDSQLDFTDAQAPFVRDQIEQLLRWHRTTELAGYGELLRSVRQQLPEPISPERACLTFDDVRARAERIAVRVAPSVAALAVQLTDAQLQHLERKQASDNETWREEWLDASPEVLQRKRYERVVSRSAYLYGDLEEPQQAAVRASIEQSSFDPQVAWADRLRRQQELRELLRKLRTDRPAPAPAEAAVRDYFTRTFTSPADPQAQRRARQQALEGCTAFSRLHAATTPAQRAHAAQRLAAIEEDLRVLAAQR